MDKKVVVFEKFGNGLRCNVVVVDECEDELGDEGSEVLYWFWNVVVCLILDELRVYLGDLKWVWWIISGLVGRVFFYVVGSYGFNFIENIFSYVILFYILLFKVFWYVR